MICRGLGIFVAMALETHQMLYIHFTIVTIGCTILYIYSQVSEAMIWVGVVFIGAGDSIIYPCVYSFLEERIDVTNKLTGLLMFTSSIATTVYPLIMGTYIESYPLVFLYVNNFSIAAVIILFIILHSTDRIRTRYLTPRSEKDS